MVTNKTKKVRKYRGHTTHGHGARKKARGSGNRGGFGMAGTGKRAGQKKNAIEKIFGSAYFGKHGFKRPQRYYSEEKKTINIGELPQKENINLTEMGYNKLLAKGTPEIKYKVVVEECSQRAKEKIEKAGGKVITQEDGSV